jgi:DNA-binding transcriptional LysR family regulator
MNDRDLLILKYLYEFKNITKTANALFISQPALTIRIKHIEAELNTALICSNNKGIYLTPAGLEAASFAEGALTRFDEFKERILSVK